MINKIAKELGINKYKNETENQYTYRVIYSAMGFWCRTIVANYNNGSFENYNYLSKAVLNKQLKEQLDIILMFNSNIESYFCNSNGESEINKIRDTLLRAGDIEEIGFDTNLKIGKKDVWGIDVGSCLLKGCINYKQYNGVASGLSWLQVQNKTTQSTIEKIFSTFNIPNKKSSEQFIDSIKKAKWEELKNTHGVEVFDEKRESIFSNCWRDVGILCNDEVKIARKELKYGSYNYYLIKKINEKIYISLFSEYQQHSGVRETQRLIYGQKAYENKKAKVRVEKFDEYSIYDFGSRLPIAEEYYLRYIGWPLSGLSNQKNKYLFLSSCTEYVQLVIDSLEMEVEEQ